METRGRTLVGAGALLVFTVTLLVGLSSARSPSPSRANDLKAAQGSFGLCASEVQDPLLWGSDRSVANNICCHNHDFAEYSGYWRTTSFLSEQSGDKEVTFYDSVSGLPLFVAPRGRTWDEFVAESTAHGWPSFRDAEVVSENVQVLAGGETLSVTGAHLGHNLPDGANRYCINIVCVAGSPVATKKRRNRD